MTLTHTEREVIYDDREAIHRLLDTAGVPSAVGAICDDEDCRSHLYHRVKWLIDYLSTLSTGSDYPEK